MDCDRTILVPDATAIVQDQNGKEIARENIASGATGIIPVNVGGGVLYTYPYDSFNTGQDVSYAIGDDKWVRDNVFIPEINSWDTSLKWSFPVLDQNDPTKLLKGSNPDGSGTNIFGNLERFTDNLGTQVYANDLVIDHYTGLMHTNIFQKFISWDNALSYYNTLSLNGYSDYFLFNRKIIIELSISNQRRPLDYSPFNYSLGAINTANPDNIYTSTTDANDSTRLVNFISDFGGGLYTVPKSGNTFTSIATRKAFTYNPTTKQMDLI